MKANKVLELISEGNYEELKALAEKEVQEEENKKRGTLKEAKFIEKYVNEIIKNGGRDYNQGVTKKEGSLIICNGFTFYKFYNFNNEIKVNCNEVKGVENIEDFYFDNMVGLWLKSNTRYQGFEFDLLEVEKVILKNKKNKKTKKENQYLTIELFDQKYYFNASFIKDLYKVSKNVKVFISECNTSPILFKAENVEGVILPCRVKEEC